MITVLFVEDDPNNVRILQRVLTRGGFVAKHTEDVEEVMQIAESGEVDIILMDVDLGNSSYQGRAVNGIKITQMLKANPKTAKVPVILVTANAREGDREQLLKDSGADDYIPKPLVDYQQFLARILELLPNN
ncbi:MAG: response regulator [Coleofasciculus sp. C3-bin4]|nr:response regulator [Coleofasciculus sp. C3-bin4]